MKKLLGQRFLAYALALCLLLGIMPTTALAASTEEWNAMNVTLDAAIAENLHIPKEVYDVSQHTLVAKDVSGGLEREYNNWPERYAALYDDGTLLISSDGNGSMPRWNADRSAITGITMGRVTSLGEVMRELVCGGAMTLEEFLPFVTRNTAESLDLFPRKGAIAPGADADLLLLDQSLHAVSTMARGRWLLQEGEMRFEPVYQD